MVYGKITTNKKDFESEDNRINYICDAFKKIVDDYEVNEIVIEDQFIGKNVSSGLKLKKLVGALCRTFRDLPKSYVTPSQWRKAFLNSTKAVNKEDVFKYAIENLPFEQVIRSGKYKNDDIIEAVAIGLGYLNKREEFMKGSKY